MKASSEAWRRHAGALADWASARIVVRRDVYGTYYRDGDEFRQATAHAALTRDLLIRHFEGHLVVGLHLISTDNRCLCFTADIDAHDGDAQADPDRNWRCAVEATKLLAGYGLHALVLDSNGRGGYHVRAFLKKSAPAAVAWWLGRQVRAALEAAGFPPIETFPKQGEVTLDRPYGNWIRLPGRHHKRDHWTRVAGSAPGEWLEGEAAVRRLLGVAGDDTRELLARYERERPEEAPQPRRAGRNGRARPDPDEAELRSALAALPDAMADAYGGTRADTGWLGVGMALHDWDRARGLDLWEEFSRRSAKYREGICREKWGTFTAGTGLTVATIFKAALDAGWTRPTNGEGRGGDRGRVDVDATGEVKGLESASDPHRLARVVAASLPVAPIRYRGDYFLYANTHWEESPDFKAETLVRGVKAELDEVAAEAFAAWARVPEDERDSKRPPKAIRVTRGLIADVEQALGSIHAAGRRDEPPFWREPRDGDPDPLKVLPVRNGLLDLSGPEPILRPHEPRLFSPFCLPFGYDPEAPPPALWQGLLHRQWGADPTVEGSKDDLESIETLEEQVGYLLLPDNSMQRIFLWIGPPRSGRGTLRKVVTALIGRRNIEATSPAALGGDFGLAPLLGKTVAFMGDARTGDTESSAIMMDRLLRISGDDPVEVNRKNRDMLGSVQLKVRFVIISNELPNFRDQSGAIVARYNILRATREIPPEERDPDLADKIIATELPGILNLAIAGLYRLRARGHFRQPESAADLIENAKDLASPIRAFVGERCDLGPDLWEEKDLLFRAWCEFAGGHRLASGSSALFGKNLMAACAGVRASRRGPDGERIQAYAGIRLKAIF